LAFLLVSPRTIRSEDGDRDRPEKTPPKTLYIWAGDQARLAPDFLAVINFDEDSQDYGKVITTVAVPPPGNVGNEPHHCHQSAGKNILACGGLLSLLRGQNTFSFLMCPMHATPDFFPPQTVLSRASLTTSAVQSGGFLVTQMGSLAGGAPGRVAEFDEHLRMVAEWPVHPPHHGFNPHGISARPELNLMVTSDFMTPSSTLDTFPGNPELRGSIRVWDFHKREVVNTIQIPNALGTMDVKLIPGDPLGRAFTAGMLDGLVYLVNTRNGTSQVVFDCEDIVPHIEVSVRGGMVQLLAMPRSGDRLLFASFQAGQVGMLDVSNPRNILSKQELSTWD